MPAAMLRWPCRAIMNRISLRPNLVRRALVVALCYMLALQGIAAALGTALSIGRDNIIGAGIIICHNAGNDSQTNGDAGSKPPVPCALCAVASSAVPLSDPVIVTVAPMAVIGTLGNAGIAPVVRPQTARAGLARAPPQFA